MDDTPLTTAPPTAERRRNIPYARIWTAQREPLAVADLADALTDRGFAPGFSDPEGETPALSEAGLAEARLEPGGPGFRVLNLGSGRGGGCYLFIVETDPAAPPDDYLARRAVPKPRLVYHLEASGPSNSDRNLTENLAEVLMLLANGAVEIGGLGTKGNRPVIHTNRWLGSIRG